MNRSLLILASVVLISFTESCKDVGTAPVQSTGIMGQVLLISAPGPIPVGWVPPPLEQVNTIQVLNSERTLILEEKTSAKGTFTISLEPGMYYLLVKESPIRVETGPIFVIRGRMVVAQAHYDNGMR